MQSPDGRSGCKLAVWSVKGREKRVAAGSCRAESGIQVIIIEARRKATGHFNRKKDTVYYIIK
jgi:hypothetical protein